MELGLVLLLLTMPLVSEAILDPATHLTERRRDARNLDCVRMTHAAAHELFRPRIPEPPARSSAPDADALVCRRRIMSAGERPPRDEAILSNLSRTVGEIAELASARGGQAGGITYLVETFYPDAEVGSKVSVAARTHLAERGQRVSDRVPLLAAGDLVVLGRLPPQEAYRLACARYFAQKSLGPDQALLAFMLVDGRETSLHAGLCKDGEWTWLR